MSPGLKSVLILVGVFSLGGVAGVAAGRAYGFKELQATLSGAKGRNAMRLEAMRLNLGLDEKQTKAVEKILADSDQARDVKMAPCRADVDAIRNDTDAKINAELTPEQKTKYEELSKAWRRRPTTSVTATPATSAQ